MIEPLPRPTRIRLYTATVVDTRDNRMMQIFHASLARDATECVARLAGRYGPDVADAADVRLGVHVASPPVVALVPAAVLEMIRRMEGDCAKQYARTFAVDVARWASRRVAIGGDGVNAAGGRAAAGSRRHP
ncbi:hypothetical protein AB5I41_25240 [Sphingomonas sp. MMS24-JH45]